MAPEPPDPFPGYIRVSVQIGPKSRQFYRPLSDRGWRLAVTAVLLGMVLFAAGAAALVLVLVRAA